MKQIATLLLILVFFSSYAQDIRRKDSIHRKENHRVFTIREKQEKSGTINLLNKEYSNKNHKRFDGNLLVVNENTIKYDDCILIFSNISNDLKRIFEVGILYPNIFVESEMESLSIKENPDSSLTNCDSSIVNVKISRENHGLWLSRTDSIIITDFKEQKNFSKSPKVRVFEFLLFYKGFANPIEYTIELTNHDATSETNLENFINGARLTLVMKGSILI